MINYTMTFAISTSSLSVSAPNVVHHSTSSKISALYAACSNSLIATPKNGIFVKCIPQLKLTPFSGWDGLKFVGGSISQYQVKMVRKSKCKNKGAYASLFGVGAPEVLVIGVVALLVFGPKGLAEAARSLGKAIRSFQPTIRELQEVSREFKSTLEREIGLDDDVNPASKSSTSEKTKAKPEGSEANIGPNGSTGEDSIDDESKMRAEQLRQALIKLQKEQEEEMERKEKEKAERELAEAQLPSEHNAPFQDMSEPSQASDNLKEASSASTPSQDDESNAVEEVTPTVATGHAPKSDTES